MKKVIKILFVLFIILITLQSIHAQDMDNESFVSDGIDNSSVKTFTDLNNKINATESSVINLTDSYKFNPDEDNESLIKGVAISRSLTISGKNNACIDGSNLARALFIDSNCSVVLENITFINGYTQKDGGAIFLNAHSNLTLKNCVFIGNVVYNSNGGALFSHKDTNTEIHNCRFIDNQALRVSNLEWDQFKCGMGSAVCVNINSTIRLNGSSFISNKAYMATLLVVSYDDDKSINSSTLYVDNCLFENNTSRANGAIYLDEFGNGEILNSVFRNNKATEIGGTVVLEASQVSVKNCIFQSNSAVRGGAIYLKMFNEKYQSTVSVADCIFSNNRASLYGGAICSRGMLTVSNSKFNDNAAGENGGAIYSKSGNLQLSNSNFNKNQARYGGAIYLKSEDSSVVNSAFVQNAALIRGGAIYSNVASIFSTNCNYARNSAPNSPNVYGVFIGQVSQKNHYYGSVKITIKLKSPWKMPLSQKIKVKLIGSKTYKTGWLKTSSKGILTIKLPYLKVGKYSLKITMESGICQMNPVFVTVLKSPCKVQIKKRSASYNSGKKIKVKTFNFKTKSRVPDVKMKIKVYTDKKYKTQVLKTDKNGFIKLSTSKLSVGKHNITISSTDKNIKFKKVKTSVKIKKASAKISAPKKVKKSSKIKVKVKNRASGKAIKNKKFTVKISTGKNQKTVKVKTNSNGILKISAKGLTKGKHRFAVVLKNKNYKINNKFTVKIR